MSDITIGLSNQGSLKARLDAVSGVAFSPRLSSTDYRTHDLRTPQSYFALHRTSTCTWVPCQFIIGVKQELQRPRWSLAVLGIDMFHTKTPVPSICVKGVRNAFLYRKIAQEVFVILVPKDT